MKITLRDRTAQTVEVYFEKSQDAEIRKTLPQKAQTLTEALADYEKTLLPGATSFGRTICADGSYIGDIWCYGLSLDEEPNGMLSYCVFEKQFWNRGVATQAVALFLKEIARRFSLRSVGACTYASNEASIRVLEKNGFRLIERFTEDGVLSCYYQWDF